MTDTPKPLSDDDQMFIRFDREHRSDACDCRQHDSVQGLLYFRGALSLERTRVAGIADRIEDAWTRCHVVTSDTKSEIMKLTKELRGGK